MSHVHIVLLIVKAGASPDSGSVGIPLCIAGSDTAMNVTVKCRPERSGSVVAVMDLCAVYHDTFLLPVLRDLSSAHHTRFCVPSTTVCFNPDRSPDSRHSKWVADVCQSIEISSVLVTSRYSSPITICCVDPSDVYLYHITKVEPHFPESGTSHK